MLNAQSFSLGKSFQKLGGRRNYLFTFLLFAALIAFEIFNYGTTEFAMTDLLGDLRFAGLRWSTILAFAFCGIDFAGIARLFTPEQGREEPMGVWYLFGAWVLAATMNALLTWWGVSIAILNHNSLGSAVIARETLLKSVPIFVALMVWLSRILIIGTFTVAGENLFNPDAKTTRNPNRRSANRTYNRGISVPASTMRAASSRERAGSALKSNSQPASGYNSSFRPAPKTRSSQSAGISASSQNFGE